MRLAIVVIPFIMAWSASATTQVAQSPTPGPEVKWTKRILDDFFEAIFRGSNAGFGLLSPELASSYRNIQQLYGEFSSYDSFSYVAHDVAPDKTEVIHNILLKGRDDPAEVIIRVAKEMQGRWSIRYIRIRTVPKKANDE